MAKKPGGRSWDLLSKETGMELRDRVCDRDDGEPQRETRLMMKTSIGLCLLQYAFMKTTGKRLYSALLMAKG